MPELDDDALEIGRVIIEAECGPGFVDVLLENKERSDAWLIEVKTSAEKASAGDTIRQLKWYQRQLTRYERTHLVCLSEDDDDVFRRLLEAGGVQSVTLDEFIETARCMLELTEPIVDQLVDEAWRRRAMKRSGFNEGDFP